MKVPPATALLIVSAVFTCLACVLWYMRSSISSWRKCPGKILFSGVSEKFTSTGGFNNWSMSMMYTTDISYSYEVDDKTFKNDRISLFKSYINLEFLAEMKADRYHPGQAVEIYVSPADPQRSFLELPSLTFAIITTVLAIACGTWGSYLM